MESGLSLMGLALPETSDRFSALFRIFGHGMHQRSDIKHAFRFRPFVAAQIVERSIDDAGHFVDVIPDVGLQLLLVYFFGASISGA